MTQKEQFIEKLQNWLNSDNKDMSEGAKLLLQITTNSIEYNNIMRNPARYKDYVVHKLKKHLKFRLSNITHSQVKQMEQQVEIIAKSKNIYDDKQLEEIRKGKRPDHDKLPDEIKACYIENLNIIHKMRELHMKLREMSNKTLPCPDSERYPFLKELIELDKKQRENWQEYDSYDVQHTEQVYKARPKNYVNIINLALGRYKKNPTDEKKKQILEWYCMVELPNEKLTSKLKETGIL